MQMTVEIRGRRYCCVDKGNWEPESKVTALNMNKKNAIKNEILELMQLLLKCSDDGVKHSKYLGFWTLYTVRYSEEHKRT
jgi:hypothetical protein